MAMVYIDMLPAVILPGFTQLTPVLLSRPY